MRGIDPDENSEEAKMDFSDPFLLHAMMLQRS
jgi:hypothetical protein